MLHNVSIGIGRRRSIRSLSFSDGGFFGMKTVRKLDLTHIPENSDVNFICLKWDFDNELLYRSIPRKY